ncbi:MAG TPA: S9 family peptidase, partial [Bacteroidales bacterium]
MKTNILLFTIISIVFMSSCKEEKTCSYVYPAASKVDTVDVYFGHKVADPYRWLEDDNSAQTAEWVKAENEITFDYLSKIPFREDLKKKLTKIWNYPKYGVPFQKGGRLFYFKNDGVQNQYVFYMQQNLEAEPEVLLDPNLLSPDGTVALSDIGISKDGKYFAYTISRGGSDWNEIYVMEIENRKMLGDHIEWVKFSGISWKGDGFFYSSYDKPKEGDELSGRNRFHKVYYHKLGTPQSSDLLVFEDKENENRNFGAYLTDDEEFVFISESESTSGNSLYAAKATDILNLKFKKIAQGFDYEYGIIDNIGDKLLMKTNDEAPKSKVVLVDFNNPEKENWKTLI